MVHMAACGCSGTATVSTPTGRGSGVKLREEAEAPSIHREGAGEGKAGRVNASEPLIRLVKVSFG